MVRGTLEFLVFLFALVLMHAVAAGVAVALVGIVRLAGLDDPGWLYIPIGAACIAAVYRTGKIAFRWLARCA